MAKLTFKTAPAANDPCLSFLLSGKEIAVPLKQSVDIYCDDAKMIGSGTENDPLSIVSRRPVYAIPVQYAATGYCYYLDASTQALTLCGNVRSCSAILLYVRSASAVTGNIVLTISCNGVTVKTVTLPVTASDVEQTITFDAAVSGLLSITRDTTNAADTLADTDKVTAIVGDDIAVIEVTA